MIFFFYLDIVDGNRKMTLSLIQMIVLKFKDISLPGKYI